MRKINVQLMMYGVTWLQKNTQTQKVSIVQPD